MVSAGAVMAVGVEYTDVWKTLCVMSWIFDLEIRILKKYRG